MNQPALWKWLRTAILTALGGGVAGSFLAIEDQSKYSLAQDLGSGKMWKFFLVGAATTLGALLLKSPLGPPPPPDKLP